jgi:hypothetical protein
MSNNSGNDRIDDVAAGDIVAVDRGSGEQPAKVVHKDTRTTDEDVTYVVTFEDGDGGTFEVEYSAGTVVSRSLDAKWESEQSPTPHN